MRRNRITSRARHNADADTLAKLARRLSESGTKLEDRIWERRLIELINERLTRGFGDAIEAALDELARMQVSAYEDLADLAESCAESATIEIDGKPHDGLLLVLPLAAWSRYTLPASTLARSVTDNIRVHLGAHLASRGAKLAVADHLFSIDQLPESFGEVYDMANRMFEAAAHTGLLKIDSKSLREPVAMLADTRYLLAAIIVPQGQALYHWQETGVDPDAKQTALEAFVEQLNNVMQPLMTGCRYRVLAPNAFHAGLRHADRDLRQFSLDAAVSYLKLAYELTPNSLQATIAQYADKKVEEIRIGISKATDDDAVIEGIVWPLLGDDEEKAQEEIEATLRQLGVTRLTAHAHRFPMEFCDDCGAPLFPNPAGHSVHAEPPEGEEEQPVSPLH